MTWIIHSIRTVFLDFALLNFGLLFFGHWNRQIKSNGSCSKCNKRYLNDVPKTARFPSNGFWWLRQEWTVFFSNVSTHKHTMRGNKNETSMFRTTKRTNKQTKNINKWIKRNGNKWIEAGAEMRVHYFIFHIMHLDGGEWHDGDWVRNCDLQLKCMHIQCMCWERTHSLLIHSASNWPGSVDAVIKSAEQKIKEGKQRRLKISISCGLLMRQSPQKTIAEEISAANRIREKSKSILEFWLWAC